MEKVLNMLEAQIRGRFNRREQLVNRALTLVELKTSENREHVQNLFNRVQRQINAVTAAEQALHGAYMTVLRL